MVRFRPQEPQQGTQLPNQELIQNESPFPGESPFGQIESDVPASGEPGLPGLLQGDPIEGESLDMPAPSDDFPQVDPQDPFNAGKLPVDELKVPDEIPGDIPSSDGAPIDAPSTDGVPPADILMEHSETGGMKTEETENKTLVQDKEQTSASSDAGWPA